MKRDKKLITKILLFIEENDMFDPTDENNSIVKEYSQLKCIYHVQLIVAERFCYTEDGQSKYLPYNGSLKDFNYFVLGNLTYKGHDYLDSVRTPSCAEVVFERGGI